MNIPEQRRSFAWTSAQAAPRFVVTATSQNRDAPPDPIDDSGRYLAETGFRALKPTIDEDAFPLLPADAG
jgi:hypothetical protein